jgi:hypothetical protein
VTEALAAHGALLAWVLSLVITTLPVTIVAATWYLRARAADKDAERLLIREQRAARSDARERIGFKIG